MSSQLQSGCLAITQWACVALCLLHFAGTQCLQAYPRSTADGSGADEDVYELSPNDTSGGRAYLELRSRNISGTERHRVPFLRFDLSTLTAPVDSSTKLRFWIASSTVSATSFSIDVFGVNDGVAGENNWNPSALSYNNAPGLTVGDWPNIDRDHEPGNVTYLGTVTYPGGNYSGALTLSTQALADFINADTNKAVTIFLEPQVAASGQDFFVHVRASEGVGTDPGDFAPTLDLPGDAPPVDTSVTISDNGGSVVVNNNVIRATFSKSTGECSEIRPQGGPNLLLNGGTLYLDSNSAGNYYSYGGSYQLVESTSDRAHLKFTGRMGQFTAQLHYVFLKGQPGFYCYVVLDHGSTDGATYLEQFRMVLRCDPSRFTQAFTSESKTGQMIAPSLLSNAPEIMDATYQLPTTSSYTQPTGHTEDGYPVYTKYDWADFMETHKAHGLSSQTIGLWMITPSEEFMNGGPTKGELFIHGTDTTPLMIETFHAGHFLGSDAQVNLGAGQVWKKMYGPYFIYLNSGTNSAALWTDALQRADQEKANWPYSWMNETAYPLARGTVTGTLQVPSLSSSNAMLILAQPGQDWQTQGSDYIFWSRADQNGRFTISKVRPGFYSLYAYVPGVSGQMELSKVAVSASQTTDLGRITWAPPRLDQTFWQIGVPDRSTAEFRFGDQMRQFGLWWRYMEEMGTNDLNYTVGTSSAANWYYAQAVVSMNDQTYYSPKWNVRFSASAPMPSLAALVVDFAGTMNSVLNVSLNGTPLTSFTTTNDGGLYRSATRFAHYTQQRYEFNGALLQAGTNTLTFQLNGHSNWSTTKPVSPASGVMYDAIRLEAGTRVNESIKQEYFLEVTSGTGGTVSGGGFYAVGATTEIRATPRQGYRFVQWSDGSTAAIRTITVNSNASYAASFALTAQGAFDQWAAANLPIASDRSFTGDADHNGIANGLEFAFGPLNAVGAILKPVRINGSPAAVLTRDLNANGSSYTTLQVQATSNLSDWQTYAVPLTEGKSGTLRAWYAPASASKVFFRLNVRLND